MSRFTRNGTLSDDDDDDDAIAEHCRARGSRERASDGEIFPRSALCGASAHAELDRAAEVVERAFHDQGHSFSAAHGNPWPRMRWVLFGLGERVSGRARDLGARASFEKHRKCRRNEDEPKLFREPSAAEDHGRSRVSERRRKLI